MNNTKITEQKAVELAERWLRENDGVEMKAKRAIFLPAQSKANPTNGDVWSVLFDLGIPVDPGHMIFRVDAQTGEVKPMLFP
jgi:hypothetical protein